MDKKKGTNENRKTIWIMFVIVIVLAIATVLLYIPKQLGYSNLSCSELNKESALIIESANFCRMDSDCIIETDIIMHICGCYELVNKNTDMKGLKNKMDMIEKIYNDKSCPIAMCEVCEKPTESYVRCVDGKCVLIGTYNNIS